MSNACSLPRPVIEKEQYFIHDVDREEYLCGSCNERDKVFDPPDSDVSAWEFWSHGWLGPCVCRVCKLSLPVYIDGAVPLSE